MHGEELPSSFSYMLQSRWILFSKQISPQNWPHSHCYMYLPVMGYMESLLDLNKWSFLQEEEGSSRADAWSVIWTSFAKAQVHWIKHLLALQRKEEKNLWILWELWNPLMTWKENAEPVTAKRAVLPAFGRLKQGDCVYRQACTTPPVPG